MADQHPHFPRHLNFEAPAIALLGNISDGFDAFGPYENFEEAADAHEGDESWIIRLRPPDTNESPGYGSKDGLRLCEQHRRDADEPLTEVASHWRCDACGVILKPGLDEDERRESELSEATANVVDALTALYRANDYDAEAVGLTLAEIDKAARNRAHEEMVERRPSDG